LSALLTTIHMFFSILNSPKKVELFFLFENKLERSNYRIFREKYIVMPLKHFLNSKKTLLILRENGRRLERTRC